MVTVLGIDEFFDYNTQEYSEILSDVDMYWIRYVKRSLKKEFNILKSGCLLVSIKGIYRMNGFFIF